MPISKVFVVRFVQLLKARRFAEAERVLERINESTNSTEWNTGYVHALEGALVSQKANDSYAFVANLDLDDEKSLRKNRKEFLKEYKSKVHQDFDRGFFAAWADFMLIAVREITNKEATEPTPEIEEKTTEVEQ
jgi:hypothetical protein